MSVTQDDEMSALQERLKRQNGYSYRLEGDKFGLDVAIDGEYEVDEGNMSLVVPFADGNRRDGVGDLLEISGIDVSRHRVNPLGLFDHGKSVTLPLGLFCDPKTQEYTVMLDPVAKTAKGKLFVYQGSGIPNAAKNDEYPHAVFCQQIFDLWVKKFIRAGSIGYQVKDARQLQPDYERGTQAGLHLLKILMLEGSVVVMPANQDTVRKSYDIAREILAMSQVCGKSLSPLLVKSLQPYVQDYNKVVTGFVPKAGCVNCNQPFSGITHNVLGKELCSSCYLRTIESQIKSIAPPQVGEIQPDKVETVKVPRGQDHTQTNIPPADWKPGQGATKDLCPNNSRITLSDDYGCPAAYDSQRKGMVACKSCGKSLRLVPFLVKDMPIEEIETYEKALVGSLEKGWNIIYQSKAAVVDDIGEIDDGKIKVLLKDGRKFIADPEDYVKKVSGDPVEDPKYDMTVEDGLSEQSEQSHEPLVPNPNDNEGFEDSLPDSEDDVIDTNPIPGKSFKSVRAKYKYLRKQRAKGLLEKHPEAGYEETYRKISQDRKEDNWKTLFDAMRAMEDSSSIDVYYQKGPPQLMYVNVMDWADRKDEQSILSAAAGIVGDENRVVTGDEGPKAEGDGWEKIKCDGKGDNPSKYSKRLIGSTDKKSRDPDEMLAGGFPHFVEDADDRYKLEDNAPNELRKWREAVAKHNQLPSTSAKTKHRKELERAFDDLKRAYDKMKRSGKSLGWKFKNIIRGGGSQKLSDKGSVRVVSTGSGKYRIEEMNHNGVWKKLVARTFNTESEAVQYYEKMERGGKSLKIKRKGYPGERRILVENVVVGDKLSTLGSQQVVRKIRRNTDDPHQMEIELENGELIYRRCGDPVYVTMRGKSLGWKAFIPRYNNASDSYRSEELRDRKGTPFRAGDILQEGGKDVAKVVSSSKFGLTIQDLKTGRTEQLSPHDISNGLTVKSLGWKSYINSSHGRISDAIWEAEQDKWNSLSEDEKKKITDKRKQDGDKWQKEQNERKEKERKEEEKRQKEIEAATKKKMADQIKKDKEAVSRMKSEAESFFSRMKNKYSVLVSYEVKTRTDYEDYDEDGNAYKTHGLDIKLEFSDWINNKKTMKLFFKNTEYGASGIDSFKDLLNTIEDDFRQCKNSKSLNVKTKAVTGSPETYKRILMRLKPGETKAIAGVIVRRYAPPSRPSYDSRFSDESSGEKYIVGNDESQKLSVDDAVSALISQISSKSLGWKSYDVPNMKTKGLGDIRHKYRNTKGLIRRLRKSASGSSMIMVRSKDMDAMEKEALEKGLTINRVGSHTKGIEKVRLSGHDGSIDAMAKRYGRMLRKSLTGWKKHKS